MATRQQLETALRNAHAAGDVPAAKKLAQALKAGQYQDAAPLAEPVAAPKPEPVAQPATPEPSMLERAGAAIQGAGRWAADLVTGSERTDADVERIPGLFESGILQDLSRADKTKIAALAQATPDENEFAAILQAQVPGLQVQYNRDAQGNVYPVIRDEQGRAARINKPGIDALDVGQFATDMAMFTPAGKATGALAGMGLATAVEGGRQVAQEAAGGEFDGSDVVLAGGLEGAGRALGGLLGMGSRATRGAPTDEAADILRAGEEFNVPVMTSDIVPPRTPAGRAAQMAAETVPVVGTGGARAAQQEARERAVDEFASRFQGGTYDDVVKSLRAQNEKLKAAAGKTYQRVVPKLNAAAEAIDGGIRFDNTRNALEAARDKFTQPGRKTSEKALSVLDDIQETIAVSDQSFQTLKENIGAWQEAIDSVDPAIRSQLTSSDTKVLKDVLRSLRNDRDQFAETVLDPREYRQLKNADAAYGEMANTMKKSRIKNILDKGDMTPEVAKNMLFSSKPSEIRSLYKGLTNEGRENARATIITEITDRLSKRASGLTPDALATELSKNREVLDAFFPGARRKELNGFIRLMDATRRAQKSASTYAMPTGQQAIPYIVGAGAAIEPTVAAAFGTVGALGRLYESPRIRSIMARMASTPPGSTQFEQLVKSYREEATKIAQAIRSQETDE